MAKIDKQVTFNRMVNGLMKQGKRSVSKNSGQCKYRGAGGAMCAAGLLIPDSKYSKKMEGSPIFNLAYGGYVPSKAGAVIKKLGHDLNFVSQRQSAHDGGSNINDVISSMINIAENEGLDIPKSLCL